MKRHLDRVCIARLRRARAQGEHGYVAVTVGIMLMVLLSFCAFAVDVGNWYFTAQRAQRAADAGALAGVTYLPGNQATAFSTARDFATKNNFTANATTTVTPAIDGRPTRLRVTVTKTVKNQFGWLMGRDTTTVARTAVADYAGPVPMGSPCNEFGNDPEPGTFRGSACNAVGGQMWANINGSAADKQNGDSYQSTSCSTSVTGRDGCTGSTNNDFATDGYFYTVTVRQAMPTLTIQLYDPVWVNTGLTCDDNTPFGGSGTTNTALGAVNSYVTAADAATRYRRTAAVDQCTGDNLYSGSQIMNTQFTVRDPSANAWDPLSYLPHAGCQRTFAGYNGNLFNAVDQYTSGTTPRSTYRADIAEGFRRWVTLCTIPNPQVGDYLIQVKSNLTGFSSANTGNRFSIRAYGSDNSKISISGREKMGIFSNKPGATTEFHMARVPSGAAGQLLKVNLYDVGDSDKNGTITLVPPSGGSFAGCTGSGVTTTITSTCSFAVTAGSPSAFNGRWQQVNIPIPSTYTCVDTDPTACWVKLKYSYGVGAVPTDVTTWTASIEGDPVRLVE